MVNSTKEFYRTDEVAILFAVAQCTVRRWISKGKLKHVHMPGGGIRVPAEEVDRLKGMLTNAIKCT